MARYSEPSGAGSSRRQGVPVGSRWAGCEDVAAFVTDQGCDAPRAVVVVPRADDEGTAAGGHGEVLGALPALAGEQAGSADGLRLAGVERPPVGPGLQVRRLVQQG